jgi:hypothetical protein
MLSWGDIRRTYRIDFSERPVMREKIGKKMIFWFRSGNGTVAELVMALRQKGLPVEVQWDENEGLTGIAIEYTVLRS